MVIVVHRDDDTEESAQFWQFFLPETRIGAIMSRFGLRRPTSCLPARASASGAAKVWQRVSTHREWKKVFRAQYLLHLANTPILPR